MHQMGISTTVLSFFSGTQAEKVGNPQKNYENCIRAEKTNIVP
jgi:hypothetical protein